MNGKTDLIFGCTGQDGSFLCKSLLEKGHNLIGLSRKTKDQFINHQRLGIEKEFEIIKGDLVNLNVIENIIERYKPNNIYNLAAQSSVGISVIRPIDTIQGIILGTLNLLESCKKLDYRGNIFFAGSSEMFGNTVIPASVDHQQKPKSPYGIGKQTSFNLVKFYREYHNLKARTGILYNHESHLRNENFVTQKIIRSAKKIKKDRNLKLTLGNVEIIRDWGWAPEYMEAVQLVTESNNIKDYIICSGTSHPLKIFIEKVFDYYSLNWKNHIVIDQSLFRPNEIPSSLGDPKPIHTDLGWRAKEDIDSIIEKLIKLSNN